MEYKGNTKQRINTIQGLRSFKETLPKNIKKILNKRGRIYTETLDNWKYIVGEDLFKVSYPKSYKNSNKLTKSCLGIMVARGHEVELEYSKNKIINKINAYFGNNVVDSIKLLTFENEKSKLQQENKDLKKTLNKVRNVTKYKFTEKISNIKNDKVKNSLLKLTKYLEKK